MEKVKEVILKSTAIYSDVELSLYAINSINSRKEDSNTRQNSYKNAIMEWRLGMFKTIFSDDIFERELERCVIIRFYSYLSNPSLTLPKDKLWKESWPATSESL